MAPWLAGLAVACLAVGLMWFFQHQFESKLMAGELEPQAAMQALARLQSTLFALLGLVALGLAVALWSLARKVREAKRWPPSGQWPVPRPLDDHKAQAFQRRLQFGAIVSTVGAAVSLLSALI
jgi:sterol desaturase/sphingolipid hydroxylase (fatty acid hydroxylase superfamily)